MHRKTSRTKFAITTAILLWVLFDYKKAFITISRGLTYARSCCKTFQYRFGTTSGSNPTLCISTDNEKR
uniref:Putative secreted peptide n=1 Tax=Anopheles braziliensis TaxID=58242 RepID=A0A2M3ZPN5_9DIPT